MKVNYYKKFGWFWLWLLIGGAVPLLWQACADGFYQRISLLGILPDRVILGLVSRCMDVSVMEENPEPLLDSMLFMAVKSRKIWWNGIIGTLELSLLGTVIGFLVAVLLVFLRVSVPDKRDGRCSRALICLGTRMFWRTVRCPLSR